MSRQWRVDLDFRLVRADGFVTPTKAKEWYFDTPDEPVWDDLLHRVFYDANHRMQQQEPHDPSYLDLAGYRVEPVSLAAMLAWDGEATMDKAAVHMPWIIAASQKVWEPAICFVVDAAGRYDGMEGMDFSELVLYRALAAGLVTDEQALAFLDKLYPTAGAAVLADRAQRLSNLVTVRPTAAYRREPGSTPYRSAPGA